MSINSQQADLGMQTPPESHLSFDLESGSASNLGADGRGEYFCTECDTRITRSTSTHNEYGHQRSCSHHQVFTGESS